MLWCQLKSFLRMEEMKPNIYSKSFWMLQKHVFTEKVEFSQREKKVLQFLFSLPINLRLRPYETPSKQNKYSEKHSFNCGGEQRQGRERCSWDTCTLQGDFSRGHEEFSLDFPSIRLLDGRGQSVCSSCIPKPEKESNQQQLGSQSQKEVSQALIVIPGSQRELYS